MIMQKGGVVHHKHCIDHPKNPHSHDQFPFTASQPAGLVDGLPSAFNLDCDENQGAAIGELVSGAFSVAEVSSPDSDFDLDIDSVDCRLILSGKDVGHASGFAKDANGAAAFNFIAGDNVHCHFTNRKKGSITLTKALVPNDDPGRFNLLVDGKTCATSVGDGGACSSVKVKGGTIHALSETAAAGANLADYAQSTKCVDQFGDSVTVSNGSVTVPPGANLVCTITNQFTNPPNGHLIVIKHVINHYLGTGTAGDFLITVQGKTAQP